MTKHYKIEDITFDMNSMTITIDGKNFTILLEKISPKLNSASAIQRQLFKISPSGYGIHWPLIDEDLSIEYLLNYSIQNIKPK